MIAGIATPPTPKSSHASKRLCASPMPPPSGDVGDLLRAILDELVAAAKQEGASNA